jgi:pimeloyl-ACP methyl ester carboxylesterase
VGALTQVSSHGHFSPNPANGDAVCVKAAATYRRRVAARLGCVFEGFDEFDIAVGGDVTLHGRHARRDPGRAVVLLHGHPRTHATWWLLAPILADAGLSVVCPDLRGYGRSTGPAPDPGHESYSDHAMGVDVATLMSTLGYQHWAVVGHDRGQGVAFRLAMDAPSQVSALVVLDGVPIVEALERADARFAELWWHWFFFASPQAERVITADPLAWYQPDPVAMGQENYDDLVNQQSLDRAGNAGGLPRGSARGPSPGGARSQCRKTGRVPNSGRLDRPR